MSFLFVDPPSPPGFVAFRHSHGGFGEMCRASRLKTPTLDLFHAASLLLERGGKAGVLDCVLDEDGPRDCVSKILARRPSTAAFRTASGSLPSDLAVAALLRESGFRGRIVFFGPQAGIEAERLLACPAVDAVLAGAEAAPFLKASREGSFDRVPGASVKRGGRIFRNAPAPRPEDLDALPVPRWDLVDYRRYSYVTSQTSWGCPYRCGYCSYPVTQGARWRTRSIEGVVAEFQALVARYGLKFVLLRDPEFTLERERTVKLCRALISAGVPITWGCETRLDTLDEELLALMAEAGCLRVAFGVESVNAKALRGMGRRPLDRADARRKAAAMKRMGILTYAMYIIGLPGETEASTRDMIDFALELDTNAASFSMATPFPGTRLEGRARALGLVSAADPAHLTSSMPSLTLPGLSARAAERLYLSAKQRWKRKCSKETTHAR